MVISVICPTLVTNETNMALRTEISYVTKDIIAYKIVFYF